MLSSLECMPSNLVGIIEYDIIIFMNFENIRSTEIWYVSKMFVFFCNCNVYYTKLYCVTYKNSKFSCPRKASFCKWVMKLDDIFLYRKKGQIWNHFVIPQIFPMILSTLQCRSTATSWHKFITQDSTDLEVTIWKDRKKVQS